MACREQVVGCDGPALTTAPRYPALLVCRGDLRYQPGTAQYSSAFYTVTYCSMIGVRSPKTKLYTHSIS